MNRRFLLTALLALLAVSATACAKDDTAPDWTLYTPEGSSVELAQVSRDKPQIILFWATWCPFCKALMPHLQSIRLEYGNDIGILAISIMEDGDPASYITEAGFDFTLLMDGDPVAEEYGITGTPGVIIIDTRRKIRFDLRNLPGIELGINGEKLSRKQTAKQLAPYWAAEIRRALDTLDINK